MNRVDLIPQANYKNVMNLIARCLHSLQLDWGIVFAEDIGFNFDLKVNSSTGAGMISFRLVFVGFILIYYHFIFRTVQTNMGISNLALMVCHMWSLHECLLLQYDAIAT